jgi:hypothetical protein
VRELVLGSGCDVQWFGGGGIRAGVGGTAAYDDIAQAHIGLAGLHHSFEQLLHTAGRAAT